MIRTIMLISMVAALLACDLVGSNDEPASVVVVTPTAPAEATADPVPTTEKAEVTFEVTGDVLVVNYGDALIEEKILNSDPIVKATMTSIASEIVVDADGKYRSALKFSLDVSEYLKGGGPSSIVAVWTDGRRYETREDAERGEARNLAKRDGQWDDREAVIFMLYGGSSYGPQLDEQIGRADHFFMALGHRYFDDDRYSLHSTRYKAWLPATAADLTGDAQEFLLDVPTAAGTAPTITLGDLKSRIAEVTAEFDGGDGSEAYETCVEEKYEIEQVIRYFREEEDTDAYDKSPQDSSLASGQPANTELHQRQNGGAYPDTKAKTWLEGRDADLFTVVQGEPTAVDVDGDGTFTTESDGIEFTETFATARPLPAGEYEIDRKEVWPRYLTCNYVLNNEWTITVDAPQGVLHEAFFDPVTDGTAVAADGTNGVLKPATFTDGDGASATIERIAWESGTVKLEVSPHTGLSDHVLDFIELDGTVSLSLNADQATVDAANDTLSWSVASRPWEDGDELMVRLLRSTPASVSAQTPAETSLPTRMPAAATVPAPTPAPIPTPASAAQACDLMDTPYDTLATTSAPGEEWRWEIRDSGSDKHIAATITDHKGVLLGKYESITKDRTKYYRESAPSNPEVYGEWLVVGTGLQRSFSFPCLDTSSFEEGASGSSDEPHFTSERFLSDEEGAERNEFWADSTGRPTRARRTVFPPEYDGVTNTETGVVEYTYSDYGEPNIIAAPCASAAPDQADNPGLMRDCINLLAAKDALRGTATLNWSVDTAITSWDGVRVEGSPGRVTSLVLTSKSLTGMIPPDLARLDGLEYLSFNFNQLTGEIPAALGSLGNLRNLRLGDNQLTGCIPPALQDVDDNDLESLELPDCATP